MRRLVWTAVGAAAGIYVYRRLQDALEEARTRGLAGNVAVATSVAASVASQVRTIAGAAASGPPAAPPRPGLAAAEVLRGGARGGHATTRATDAPPSRAR